MENLEIKKLKKELRALESASNITISEMKKEIETLIEYTDHKTGCTYRYNSECSCELWKIANWKSPLYK